MDWPGILLIAFHIVLAPSAVMISFVEIMFDLDPFYFVFELFLPSPYYRSLGLILGIPLVRFLLSFVCIFEFQRFFTVLIFVALSGARTMLECMTELKYLSRKSEMYCLNLYARLRVLLTSGDFFLRHVLALLLTCGQIIITSFWWVALKCGNVLPNYIIIFFYILAIISVGIVVILLPQAVEISESSFEFVTRKKSTYHTFNRRNKNYNNFVCWKSQRNLPIRFGVQFTLNKDTPIGYFEVMMTNLTNSVFLIQP